MKNIYILPTENYSPLVHSTNKYGGYFKSAHYSPMKEMGDSYQNIYITSDEEIKEGDWMIRDNEQPIKVTKDFFWDFGVRYYKIILTTDQDLISDGVQAIPDEFLEWFVNNPSCESVEVHELRFFNPDTNESAHCKWELYIPKEESKQETHICKYCGAETSQPDDECYAKPKTLEEVAEYSVLSNSDMRANHSMGEFGEEMFKLGAKWQAERMYSEEEVLELILKSKIETSNLYYEDMKEWFEQFKKK